MPFLNVFLKTLGFFIGITTFIIILNILINFIPSNDNDFEFIEGKRDSNNIIAVLNLNGPILSNLNQSFINDIYEYIDPDIVKKYLSKLEKINPKILIIKINSPGGTVAASASLEKILYNFKKKNNLEIYFHSDQILASGGYWVATTGDKIFANYGSIIGSIGVSGPSWYYYDKPMAISTNIIGQKIIFS